MSPPLLRQFRAVHTSADTVDVGVELVAENPCCDWSVQELEDSTPENRHVALTLGDNVNRRSRYGTASAPLNFTLNRAAATRNVRVTVRRPHRSDVDYDVAVR